MQPRLCKIGKNCGNAVLCSWFFGLIKLLSFHWRLIQHTGCLNNIKWRCMEKLGQWLVKSIKLHHETKQQVPQLATMIILCGLPIRCIVCVCRHLCALIITKHPDATFISFNTNNNYYRFSFSDFTFSCPTNLLCLVVDGYLDINKTPYIITSFLKTVNRKTRKLGSGDSVP